MRLPGLRRFKIFMLIMVLLGSALAPLGSVRAQSGQDCDDNAVIRCGVTAATLVQKYRENQQGNVQAVFSEFGIPNEAALSGLVAGRVTSNNEVYVGSKLVATNALTAGRHNMPGSTPILNGQFYRRSPSVSFSSASLSALVKMDGETFRFAIIESCGNPVTAQDVPNPTPPPPPPPPPANPAFSIQKDVRKKGETSWLQHVSTKAGEKVEFRVIVKNTGDTELKNVKLRDKLPASLENPVAGGQFPGQETLFSTGTNLGNIAKGQQKEVTFEATVKAGAEACGSARLQNVAYAKPDDLPEENDDASVEVCKVVTPPPPTPPPVTPPTPTPTPTPPTLPDTGAGAAAGLFSITTLLGAALHKLKEFYLTKL